MKKIACVTNAPPLSGMGKPAREVFENIKALGKYELDFYYLDAGKGVLEKNDIKTAEIKNLPKPFALKPLSWWRIAKKMPKDGYDLWHFTNQTLSFIARQNFLLTVHDLIELLEPQEKFGRYAARYLYGGISKAKHIICVSKYTKKVVQETYQIPDEKISVIPTGVSEIFGPIENAKQTIAFQEFLQKNRIPKEARLVLYVGSDHPRKNLKVLAESFAKVKELFPNVFLIKVGEPGLISGRIDFQKKLNELKISEWVRFVGNIDDRELQLLYNYANVFVFPSLQEGFGVPPLEAMACGLPVVCSNATSLPEVIGNAGILLNPNDTEGFANAIMQILKNENAARDFRERGIKQSKLFLRSEIATQTAMVYEKLLRDS